MRACRSTRHVLCCIAEFDLGERGVVPSDLNFLHAQVPKAVQDAARRPLPGIQPMAQGDDWLEADMCYAPHMAIRRRLLDTRYAEVVALRPAARNAAAELLDTVLSNLGAGYERAGQEVYCPDGGVVRLEPDDPMGTCGRLIQEDLCIMQDRGDIHALEAAVLCFPASWMLSEKIGHPLLGIHEAVPEYDDNIAKRVQRLFHGIQVNRPLWRANMLHYHDPDLFQPRSVAQPRRYPEGQGAFLRCERQCLMRLPHTQAVVFSIKTYVARAT